MRAFRNWVLGSFARRGFTVIKTDMLAHERAAARQSAELAERRDRDNAALRAAIDGGERRHRADLDRLRAETLQAQGKLAGELEALRGEVLSAIKLVSGLMATAEAIEEFRRSLARGGGGLARVLQGAMADNREAMVSQISARIGEAQTELVQNAAAIRGETAALYGEAQTLRGRLQEEAQAESRPIRGNADAASRPARGNADAASRPARGSADAARRFPRENGDAAICAP
jgi:hypothetical protein